MALSSFAPLALADHELASPVRIDSMDVRVTIDHHYAVTVVRETISNPTSQARAFEETVAAPGLAFITRFALETGGAVYDSRIEDAAAARAAYETAAQGSRVAALIESSGTDTYRVSLSLPAETTVVVHFAYEELIARSGGEYEYRFPLVASAGGRTIGMLSIEGTLTGSALIGNAAVSLGTLDRPTLTGLAFAYRSSHLVPAADYQVTWTDAEPAGTLLVHASPTGGVFVYTFAPEGAGIVEDFLPKDIVFVIDVSGSMENSIDDVKAVFSSIIRDLRPSDRFSVVTFAQSTTEWAASLMPATPANIEAAAAWVGALGARGATNLDAGLSTGIAKLHAEEGRAPALVLLSDGEPTTGTTDPSAIRANLRAGNAASAAVYTLAFGPHADTALLQALAAEHDGEARRIYIDGDAAAQIRGFYDSISSPVLSDVEVTFPDGVVSAVPAGVARVFAGGEVVASGTLEPGATTVEVVVTGTGAEGPFSWRGTFEVATAQAGAFVARAAAFAQIRALEPAAMLGDTAARAEIVSLALANRFVTTYTSLVIVVPVSLDPTAVQGATLARATTSGTPIPSDMEATSALPSGAPTPRSVPGPGVALSIAALGGLAAVAARRGRRARRV